MTHPGVKLLLREATQHRSHSRYDFAAAGRFRDVVVRTRVQSKNALLLRSFRSKKNHWSPGKRLDASNFTAQM
ncbi:MAG: hypothetical protein WA383_18875 [Terriglobales bacterium]